MLAETRSAGPLEVELTVNHNHLVGLILMLVVIGLALADLWLLKTFGQPGTISSVCKYWSQQWPLLPLVVAYLAGLVIGHLFLGQ